MNYDTKRRIADLALRLVFPAALITYLYHFSASITGRTTIVAGYPRVLIGSLALLIALALVMEIRDAHRQERPLLKRIGREALPLNWWRAPAIGIALITFYVAGATIGFFVSTFIFVTLVMLMLGLRRATILLPVGIIFTVACYYVFVVAFRLRLPEGVLF